MKISVVPRNFFEARRGTDSEADWLARSNVISINAPSSKEEPPFSRRFWRLPNLLTLFFDDVSDPVREAGAVFMTPSDGQSIVSFVTGMDRALPLYIHCTAGISRSGAVGEVLDWFFNCRLEEHRQEHVMFQRRHPCLIPNRWVRRVLLERLYDYESSLLQTP